MANIPLRPKTPFVARDIPAIYDPPVSNDIPKNDDQDNIHKLILKVYNKLFTIPKHLLDNKKRVIVTKVILKQIVSILCKVPAEEVIIDSVVDVDCCGAIGNIEAIDDIKIRHTSLYIYSNEIFNKISTDYNISTDKILFMFDRSI